MTEPAAQFEDPLVQAVYAILCSDEVPPAEQHWEGWAARRIVDALFYESDPRHEPHDDPACFGVACPKHAECARYHAIETAPAVTIDSCQRGNTWPMFIQRKEAEE